MTKINLNGFPNMAKQKSVVDNLSSTVDKTSTVAKKKEETPPEPQSQRQERIETQQKIADLEAQLKRMKLNEQLQKKHASLPVNNRWLDQFPPPAYTREEDKKLKGDV